MMDSPFSRRALYPPVEPRQSGRLPVGDGHELYWEECGRSDGVPVVVLHGGPGGGLSPAMRRFFDPRRWRVLLFDQRGAGRSIPRASLHANTTAHLVEDVERLRERLGVQAWAVFGGSWGSTLALAYAQAYPERVLGLILRGVFLFTRAEVDWFYRGGISALLPEAWERFLAPLAPEERSDPVAGYHRVLARENFDARRVHARAWADWESAALTRASARRHAIARHAEPESADALARIECHYMANDGFFVGPDDLMDGIARVSRLPCFIVQGRLDLVTPPRTAVRIAKAWPGARLTIVENAGHAAVEPGLVDGLVRATDELALRLS
jgi:proline iminopeptidase